MSSSTFVGNPDSPMADFCPAPPPPPPPPPVPGQVPVLRINTAEAPLSRRPQNNSDPYEPPAAIQNAMMTKDKKPFTYTPGMGGKLDLSQIRSPRMARRVAKNANDEGIDGPPKSALEPKQAQQPTGTLFAQPQVAVPVFPVMMPTQPSLNRAPSTHVSRVPSNVSDNQPDLPRTVTKLETKISPLTMSPAQPASPQTPSSPPIVTLSKAPTPWLQNKNKQPEDLPEWAKRTNANRPQESSPESPISPLAYQPIQISQPIPAPPAHQQPRPQQQQQQHQVIPKRIEDRPSVFSVKNEPGHHQLKQPSQHHNQRWGQAQSQNEHQQHQPQQSGGARIIPIMMEDSSPRSPAGSYAQPQVRNIPIETQGSKVIIHRGPPQVQQQEPGPVQSRAFRVLQKITDTDSETETEANADQIRKLQLTEDDKVLMNKFKEQVDGDTYLHQEEDPRYRGAAIPSRAFRFLQNMTDSGDAPTTSNVSRAPSAVNKKQNRNSKSFEETQANLPPSEQQVQEPKKYMGSAIPSRSFRILQAMTSPENIATQENRQPDFTSQTENNMPGNQQGLFFPPCPSPFWNPDAGWWGYYPIQYAPNTDSNNVAYDPYAYYGYGDGNAYAYYPMYDPNYAQSLAQNYEQSDSTSCTHSGGNSDNDKTNLKQSYDPNYNSHYGQPTEEICYSSVYPPTATDTNEENSNFLTVPKWNNRNTSRSSSNSSKDSDDTMAMNITDEEGSVPEVTVISVNPKISKGKVNKDDTDQESSDDDSESESDSSSDSSSSDSESESEYVAYTAGLNAFDKDAEIPKSISDRCCDQSLSATTISDDTFEQSSRLSSDKLSCSDCDSDADDEYQIESLNNDCILPHQLSIIYEDTEQTDVESLKNYQQRSKEPLAETDDPPDDVNAATVSVSLPLRFKFSVSENNEDVTTLTVGDSLIKSAEERVSQSRRGSADDNDIQVNLKISKNNDTSVDFTLKKQRSEDNFNTELNLTKDEMHIGLKESSVDAEITLKKNDGSVKKIDCNANVETEFTVRTKKTDVTKHVWKKDLDLDTETDIETCVSNEESRNNTETECIMKNTTSNGSAEEFDTEYTVTDAKTDLDKNVCREVLEHKSLRIKEKEAVETEFTVRQLSKGKNSTKQCNSINEVPEEVNNHHTSTKSETSPELIKVIENSESLERKGSRIKGNEAAETELIVKKLSKSKKSKDQDYNKRECETRDNHHTSSRREVSPVSTNGIENNESLERTSSRINDKQAVEAEFTVKKLNKGKKSNEQDNSKSRVREKGIDHRTPTRREPSPDLPNGIENSESLAFEFTVQNEEKELYADSDGSHCNNNPKHLLSVQNSRDETDDEDSGVTSDMSRLISEADTDSECTSLKRMSKYQRTQTHSRLFKLLNDDSILAEDFSEECDSPPRREHLSLPLKPNVFNYDENYYSNYSSGITSPDYSPVCEQSWRRLHESENSSSVTTPNECVEYSDFGILTNPDKPTNEDPYFQTWKKVKSPPEFDYDILPSLAFKKLENRMSHRAHKINILCPRIKSSKNVPLALQADRRTVGTSIPLLSSAKNDHC